MKKFLLIVALFSVICNGCYELDFDTDFHSGIYEKRYSRIYYTTSDNRPIELDTSLENGVVSNTYSNGQGVLVFEDLVTKIEDYTFSDCEKLTSLKIPESVTKIGYQAFYRCDGLKKIDIPKSVTTIGDSAFYCCSSLTSVTIPKSVTIIGNWAFSGCSSLTSVHITDLSAWCKIDFNGYSANPLYYAKKIYLNNELVTDLVIPSDIAEIKSYAFYNCSGLTSVTIPDSVTNIGFGAFCACRNLTSVTIGDSVTTIGELAFYGCSSLTSVYCKATTPPAGGNNMFYGNASGRKIYVPMESVEAYKSASYWSDYKSSIVGYNF